MKKGFRYILGLAAVILTTTGAHGQYYNSGQTPLSQRWRTITTDSLQMIFPDYYQMQARRMLHYMDSARGTLNTGFSMGPMKTPVVFKTENFISNGMALLAPRRIEIIATPDTDSYSEPWLKHLAVHEYRHMVQYSNINRRTVKTLSYIFGQQAPFAATALIPFWFIEGDAVMAETQASRFGRGLQPSFSMHYRALGEEILARRGVWSDRWFVGSYKDYVPSHYELGYQMVAHSMRAYDTYIGESMYDFTARYPILFSTAQMALRKRHGTSTPELFRETFAELNDYWSSLPERHNSARVIPTPVTSYTRYRHPQFVDENTLLALKSDMDRTARLVLVDVRDGSEQVLCHVGPVSTRPSCRDGVVWWTEYRQSTLWEQRVYSQLCSMSLSEGKPRDVKGRDRVLYPTPTGNGQVAYVEYDYRGTYSIVWGGERIAFPADVSLHGLAWDDLTDRLYYIALSDPGMWIGEWDRYGLGKERENSLFPPVHVTISDLRAGSGKLYFGSVYCGYDEAHLWDLSAGKQFRITQSRYGSFDPAPNAMGDTIALTVYDSQGYKPAVQPVQFLEHVPAGTLPANVVNPPVPQWGMSKMDGILFTTADRERSEEAYPARKYHRAGKLFNFHSWFPLNLDPRDPEANSDLGPTLVGITVMSQDVLSSTEAVARYGYLGYGYSMLTARLSYGGLGVRLSGDVTWSDKGALVSKPDQALPGPGKRSDYFNANLVASLPMLLTSGHKITWLTPSVQYSYRNIFIYDTSSRGYQEGEHRISVSLQLSGQVRRAERDLLPRWGYLLRAGMGTNPGSSLFRNTWSAYARGYMPGLAPHHGLNIAVAYQDTFGEGAYAYSYKQLIPRGHEGFGFLNYGALSANYHLPLAYPEAGLRGVLFVKRVSLAAGFDYARYKYHARQGEAVVERFNTLYSWGGTFNFDVNFFRLPSQSTTTLSLSVFFPSDQTPYISGSFSIPF